MTPVTDRRSASGRCSLHIDAHVLNSVRWLPERLADDAGADSFLAAWINLECCSDDRVSGAARGSGAEHRGRFGARRG